MHVANVLEPDFVLLDTGQPGMDGYEVVVRLRRRGLTGHAVPIAITDTDKPKIGAAPSMRGSTTTWSSRSMSTIAGFHQRTGKRTLDRKVIKTVDADGFGLGGADLQPRGRVMDVAARSYCEWIAFEAQGGRFSRIIGNL